MFSWFRQWNTEISLKLCQYFWCRRMKWRRTKNCASFIWATLYAPVIWKKYSAMSCLTYYSVININTQWSTTNCAIQSECYCTLVNFLVITQKSPGFGFVHEEVEVSVGCACAEQQRKQLSENGVRIHHGAAFPIATTSEFYTVHHVDRPPARLPANIPHTTRPQYFRLLP